MEGRHGAHPPGTNTRTQVELAECLGIRQSSVSDAKRRNSIPSDWLVTLAMQLGLHPQWVLTGKGGMYAVPSDQPDTVLLAERLQELESTLRASVARDFAASISLDDAKVILAAKLPRGAVVQVSYHDTITGTGGATGLEKEEVIFTPISTIKFGTRPAYPRANEGV